MRRRIISSWSCAPVGDPPAALTHTRRPRAGSLLLLARAVSSTGYTRPTRLLVCVPRVYAGGDLLDHVYQAGALPEADAACITRQLASFLAYAHSKHVMHRCGAS
jgi:serine/threonine protein kinase